MQYYKPDDPYFVGDCMPFFHDGVFHLYWLLDENHHQALGGLGGHQWAHASTRDLVHWTHHPLALAIDAPHEGSICTGTVFYHAGSYHACFATRWPDRTQHLGWATSDDGITFHKRQPNPLASPPVGYAPQHYRDPFVFRDEATGRFHMLVTAERSDYALPGYGGCLAHLVSADLEAWEVVEPFLFPGYPDVPECPDHFFWNGWYYLIFSSRGNARYRMARTPFGPWLRPAVDTFDGPLARVMKTAPFTGGRRIGVAFLAGRAGDQDDGRSLFGGNALFRELVQQADGTLGTKFVPEMALPGGVPLVPILRDRTEGVRVEAGGVRLDALQGLAVAEVEAAPANFRLVVRATVVAGAPVYGVQLRAAEFGQGVDLRCLPAAQRVELHNVALDSVEGLAGPVELEIVAWRDIVDVCIGGRRCLANRLPQRRAGALYLYAQGGTVRWEVVERWALAG